MNPTRSLAIMLLTAIATTMASRMDLPDPTPQICARYGGRHEWRRVTKDGYRGFCVFADNTECESWAFRYSKCKPSQIRSADSSPQQQRMHKLVANLDQRGIKLSPVSLYWGGTGARLGSAMPSGPLPIFTTGFERKPADLFLIHATETITAAQGMERLVRGHAGAIRQPSGFEVDSLRCYRCDAIIVVYLALPPRGFDPAVGKALTEACGLEFARYPL